MLSAWRSISLWQLCSDCPINKLIDDITRDPFTGIGKPEPLKYHLPGAWSRRIDDKRRLVYIVTEAEIIILAACYCY
ncbi:MAG TPA: Txe/YoeB family addiction module toxin [Streptosporangiaceae bacterium]|nr:Txe/YoeB family addiction module toxin [Streptosporangiaceae bacterium]